jgi:8-oxo-dGTP pyrophosphatase MutT (NUDIX family)
LILFEPALRDRIAGNIASLIPTVGDVDGAGLRQAAVALILAPDSAGEAHFLLTRRAPKLGSHAGQNALPGGVIDPGESAEAAARRETREEIGLHLGDEALLGALEPYATRSGFIIRPFVYWAEEPGELTPSPGEVAEIRYISLQNLFTPGSPVFLEGETPDRPILRLLIGDRQLHAPTAAVVLQFRAVGLEGRYMSVAHFDQPDFARR